MQKEIKLMPDYHCFPLWKSGGEVGNMSPDELPLTDELRTSLLRWAMWYDGTMNYDDPTDSPGLGGQEKEEAFEKEGRRLWKALQEQLSPNYKVVYFSQREGKVLE